MSQSMRYQLTPSEDKINHKQETQYCINKSYQFRQQEKKKQFQDKLTFKYSLQKINKQKLYGQVINLMTKAYPVTCKNRRTNQFMLHQYSSVISKRNKIQNQQTSKLLPIQANVIMKKIRSSNLNSNRRQSSTLGAFWMFKKKSTQQIPKKKGIIENQKDSNNKTNNNIDNDINKKVNITQQAYIKLLLWGKQSPDIENSLVSKQMLKNYLSRKFGDIFAQWFLNFYQIKSFINFKEFKKMHIRFYNMSIRQSHLITYFLFDRFHDGFICPKDIFRIFEKQLNSNIQIDILKIVSFVRNNQGREDFMNQKFKIEHLIIRDNWLTFKDYQMYFKKIDQPFLEATNKKDTIFAKSFAVLDHREKVRSTRKQINQKKIMYNEMYGELQKIRKNYAYIDENDYKLNYSFFYEIFGDQVTNLFEYFQTYLFG